MHLAGGILYSEYVFPHEPWAVIRLDEAVNLMQGRYVYRKPEVGPGYWIGLPKVRCGTPGEFRLMRTDFNVREYLAETGLGGWLGLNGWVKLAGELERGHQCGLAIGAGLGMRAVKMEADPVGQKLKVMDTRGREVGVKR
jgi:hypothetical protein